MTTTKSVEEICKLIEQYKLMSSNHYAAMRARWFRPNRQEVADVEQFKKWLILNRYLTEFVTSVLSGRKSDQLVLNQYRLQDQMISGPMAGGPAGDLAADCLLLAPASKSTPNQRTVKILHAGVRRKLFDETAIGRSISIAQGIPADLELKNSSTFDVAGQVTIDPADDIF